MPDQFGNPTPADVMAAIIAERDGAVAAARTPQERRLAQLGAIGKTVFAGFDPRLVRANEINDALQRSVALEQHEGEDQLDYEIRQARRAFDEMRNVDPSTAAEISSKLTELESERLERTFLQQDRELEREVVETDLTVARQRNYLEGLQYALDPKTGQLTSDYVNMNEPGAAEEVDRIMGQGLVLIPADDVVGLADTSAADFKLWNNSGFESQLERIDTQIQNVGVANQLAEVFQEALKEGDNPAAFFDGVERRIGGFFQSLDDVGYWLGDERPSADHPAFREGISEAEDWLRREGIRSGVSASLLTTLAYTRARTFDNRVTDQDFRKAYDMLGADSGDPSIIMSNLRAIVFGDSQTLFKTVRNRLDAEEPYLPEEGQGRAQHATVSSQLGLLEEFVNEFDQRSDSILQAYGVGDSSSGGNRPRAGAQVRSNGRTFNLRVRGE